MNEPAAAGRGRSDPSGSPSLLLQFIKYASAGGVGTLVHYALLFGLVEAAGIGAVAASTCGAVAGALVNYSLNYHYTFGSRRLHRQSLPRYAAVSVAGVALNAFVVFVGATAVGWHYEVAEIVVNGVVGTGALVVTGIWMYCT